jgi:hypothetical protein
MKLPAGACSQLVNPLFAENVPGGQAVALTAPVVLTKLPAGASSQTLSPATGANVPRGHSVAVVADPPVEKLPSGASTQTLPLKNSPLAQVCACTGTACSAAINARTIGDNLKIDSLLATSDACKGASGYALT